MKASALKTEQRVSTLNNRGLHIQSWGDGNDQPQRYMEIISASGTGSLCVDIYSKFIAGRGFTVETLYKAVINTKGTTVDELLKNTAEDLAMFGGFAIHVNYNANYQIVSATHIPLEFIRFEELDDDGNFNRVAIHSDWGRRFLKLRQFKPRDIDFINLFNPNPEVIALEVEAAGGWNGYRGQVLYYSNQGAVTYPMPVYESVVTDMSTEEGLSNIRLRNSRNSFLPAGMLIDRDNTAESKEQEEETKKELTAFQGDANAGKLFYVQLKNQDTAPEFVPFETKNFDKEFTVAEQSTTQNIGRRFSQPPILRCEDVGANFGADLMSNAYNYYNSVTETERDVISREFVKIFSLWYDSA
ncbi:MAG: hypothetical protein RR960_07850, partial [Alistipes sp.]